MQPVVDASRPDSLAPAKPGFRLAQWIALAAIAAGYAAYAVAQWSLAYIDFGDGNYMYIGRRIAEGAVVYRDILAPQPPCHLFLGALIWRVAWLLSLPEPVYAFRAFSLALHLATMLLVARLALRAWGRPWTAVVAAAIYLWLPLGHWWALGYQSEPLETFFLLAMALAALRGTARGDTVAGAIAALATLTNATVWPFLGVQFLYWLVADWRRLGRFLIPWVAIVGGTFWALQFWTDGAFLVNVVFNQVGTYPPTWAGRVGYGLDKILNQGGNILLHEGFFVFLALIGLARLARRSPLAAVERGALAWFLLATIGSIVYVTKGGTEDYIFTLGEPAVAILAAGELAAWGRRLWGSEPDDGVGGQSVLRRASLRWVKLVGAATLLLFATLHGFQFHAQVFLRRPYELGPVSTDRVVHLIERFSRPGEPILAPPFYAVRAGRTIWGDYSELFIWIFKYRHDRWPDPPERPNRAGEGWMKISEMAKAIDARSLPIAILEMDQTGIAEEPMKALRRGYRPVAGQWDGPGASDRFIFTTRNTRLGIFVVAPADETPDQAAARARQWDGFDQELLALYGRDGARKFGLWLRQPSAGRGNPF
jgi:hypothetical protein